MLDLTWLLRSYSKYRLSTLNSLDPKTTQKEVLLSLIKKASNTKFGKDHSFASIESIADYQSAVPIRSYDDFWGEYWQAHFPFIQDITWPGAIPYFCVSSGTSSGRTKNIPLSHEMLKANSRAGLDLLLFHAMENQNSKLFGGKCFFLGGSTNLSIHKNPDTGFIVKSGDLSGIQTAKMPWWAKSRFFPPLDVALISDWEQKLDALASKAIQEDIRMISGVPSWMLILFDAMCKAKGVPIGTPLKELLPNLELVVHGGVNMTPYRDQFDSLLEGTSAETREVYPASEGFIGIADKGKDEGLRLLLDNGIFYEFIPFSELNSHNPTRHTISEVETGVNYAVILTTCSGLWSYKIGDTIKFVSTDPHRVVVTGRTSYYLSAFGEHLIGEEVEYAVEKAAKKTNLVITDYSVGAIFPRKAGELGGHLFIIEANQSENLNSSDSVINTSTEFSETIKDALCEKNEDYEAHLADGFGLNPPEVLLVKKGTFAGWMAERGKLGGQNKVPRIINDNELFAYLKDFAQKYNY